MISRFARLALGGGAVAVAAGLSIKTVGEYALGDRLTAMDAAILRWFAGLRSGFLNGAAVDFTSLGSGTLLVIATAVIFVLLVSTRDAYGSLHLLCAGGGAAVLTSFFKHYFARPRPTVVEHLVHVAATGHSYPSGHALGTAACYFSFALIARRHLPRHATREFLIGFTLLVIVLVGMSRIYLGVHYASDVISGTLMGVGWSLLLAGAFSMHERSRQRRSRASYIAAEISASPLAIDSASSSVAQK